MRIGSPLIFFLRKDILDYEIPGNSLSKLSKKPKVFLNLNEIILSLYL